MGSRVVGVSLLVPELLVVAMFLWAILFLFAWALLVLSDFLWLVLCDTFYCS